MDRKNNLFRVAWGVTGSGTYLRDTFRVMKGIREKYGVKITTYLSYAGLEVVRIYGMLGDLNSISPGGYYEEVITPERGGYSNVYSGRFNRGQYGMLIVSPATSNTVSKIVYGIADSIVTNIVAQAVKGGVPVIILPSDIVDETEIPCRIDRERCELCMECIDKCPYGAIELVDDRPRIDLLKCYGCMICYHVCPVNAIYCWERIKINIREIDRRNIESLSRMDGIKVINNPLEIVEIVEKMMLRSRT